VGVFVLGRETKAYTREAAGSNAPAANGLIAVASSSAEFAAYIKSEIAR
jgi:hypothetical protein